MSWRCQEPGHQLPWYWPCWNAIIWSPHIKSLWVQKKLPMNIAKNYCILIIYYLENWSCLINAILFYQMVEITVPAVSVRMYPQCVRDSVEGKICQSTLPPWNVCVTCRKSSRVFMRDMVSKLADIFLQVHAVHSKASWTRSEGIWMGPDFPFPDGW